MPLSEFNDWHDDDRDSALGLRLFRAESCAECQIHPSVWKPELGGRPDAVVPVWKHCRVCELLANARKAGPPSEDPGWHLSLKHNH